jgi:hypothetical protein
MRFSLDLHSPRFRQMRFNMGFTRQSPWSVPLAVAHQRLTMRALCSPKINATGQIRAELERGESKCRFCLPNRCGFEFNWWRAKALIGRSTMKR